MNEYRLIARALRTHAERCTLDARSRGNAGPRMKNYRKQLRSEARSADTLAAALEGAEFSMGARELAALLGKLAAR